MKTKLMLSLLFASASLYYVGIGKLVS